MFGIGGLVEFEFSLVPEMKKHFVQAPSEESYSINFVEVGLLASFSTASATSGHSAFRDFAGKMIYEKSNTMPIAVCGERADGFR